MEQSIAMNRVLFYAVAIVLSVTCLADMPMRPAGKEWPPVIGAWFWDDQTLEENGYKPFLDAVAAHSPYTLLTTSLRISKGELVDPPIYQQIGKAVREADKMGLKVAFDLDVRLARRAFQARYPHELQEELVLKIVELPSTGNAEVVFEGSDLGDHMTGSAIPYLCLTSRVVRVYSFVRGKQGIDPQTVKDITAEGIQSSTDGPRKLRVIVPAQAGRSACVIASHTYLTPDVFAPHIISFQREILRLFSDLPLAGVLKDEWGFLPDHTGNPAHDRYWYSAAFAKAYMEQSGGRDLVRDALLMHTVENGRDRERMAAINLYRKMCRQRNVEIEKDYYQAGKELFGKETFIGTHATWTPYPGPQEFRKNGLDWWEVKRDVGQSDETTPYACRTSLAKRWGYPSWYNQYYSPKVEDYTREFWQAVLSGGRINFHPLYPRSDLDFTGIHRAMMHLDLMRSVSRLRMLDFITKASLNCPVAVVFGHACAMNWAGPSYNKLGLEVVSAMCTEGYPADLIPSSMASQGELKIDREGYVNLGSQRYAVVVLYQPEFGDEKELAFFEQASKGKSKFLLVGDWTKNFKALPLDGNARLGKNVAICSNDQACVAMAKNVLKDTGITPVTGWSHRLQAWGLESGITHVAPPMAGFTVLTDGTFVRIAGSDKPGGDLIRETIAWKGHTIVVDAMGLLAIRFDSEGKVADLAAGGLKSIKTDGLEISLPERLDIAFSKKEDGSIGGVIQGLEGDSIPASLKAISPVWQRLNIPPLLPLSPQ